MNPCIFCHRDFHAPGPFVDFCSAGCARRWRFQERVAREHKSDPLARPVYLVTSSGSVLKLVEI